MSERFPYIIQFKGFEQLHSAPWEDLARAKGFFSAEKRRERIRRLYSRLGRRGYLRIVTLPDVAAVVEVE